MHYSYVLFDLDGTLTDPKLGITKSVQYALKDYGVEEKNLDKLEPFIGPPLRDSFREFYGMNDEEIKRAVDKFREYFQPNGIYENRIYPGMAKLLRNLKKEGIILAIASSKPQEFVHIVLKNFEIEDCFSIIVGSEKDGRRDTKIEVMEETFSQLQKKAGKSFDKSKVLMVGDRKFDVEGARHFGVDSAAVTYGYAPEGELEACSPTYLVDSVQELGEVISGQPSYKNYLDVPALKKTWECLYPLFLFWGIEIVVYLLLSSLLDLQFVKSVKGNVEPYKNVIATLATWPALNYLYKISAPEDASHIISARKRKRFRKEGILVALYAFLMAMGLNLLVTAYQLTKNSQSYQEVAKAQYSVSFATGLIIYGLLMPFIEEILFRGILYNRLKKYFPLSLAMLANAVLFGIYHGNLVQFCYALIMGLCMVLVYEYYGMIFAPVLFHMVANSSVYIATKLSQGSGDMKYIGISLVCIAGGVGITFYYFKKGKIKWGNSLYK